MKILNLGNNPVTAPLVDDASILKESVYNTVINENKNSILLFNTLRGALCVLSPSVYYFLSHNQLFCLNTVDNDIKDELHALLSCGFLVDFNKDERDSLINRINDNQDPSDFGLVIAPTTRCNLKCTYCFEKNLKELRSMPLSVEDAVIRFAENGIQGKNRFSVMWYGGEPLLRIDAIQRMSKRFIEISDNTGIDYNAGIITNGVLLDKDNVKILSEECKISYAQITLDGLQWQHDRRRISKNGESTFHKIISGIDSAKGYLKISIRINVDRDNLCDVKELINWIETERKHWQSYVSWYVAPITNTFDSVDTSTIIPKEEFGKICSKEFLDFFIRKHDSLPLVKPDENNFLDIFCAQERISWRGPYPYPLKRGCGAISSNLYSIDPDGDLYKCWDTIGNKSLSVGSVFNGIKSDLSDKWVGLKLLKECEKCKELPICQGGCPSERLNSNTANCRQDVFYYKSFLSRLFQDTKSSEETSEFKKEKVLYG